MTTPRELAAHPLADIFPLMEGEDFDALMEDIKANWLREPIMLYENLILDGRNRYRAVIKAGLQYKLKDENFRHYSGSDPLGLVVSANLHRRHLTESQRALIAARIVTTKLGDNQFNKPGVTNKQAAAMLGVSEALPGLPLARCGLVVVDCDRHGGADGVAELRKLGLLPFHPITQTKSGEHHWFRQPAQPVRFAQWAGGQVLGEGRFVVGYSVPEGRMPELPEVFRAGKGADASSKYLSTVLSRQSVDGVASDRVEALRAMDPRDWNGEHDAWFRLLMGCKFVGITLDEFVEWSTQDRRYANDGEIIRKKWESVEPKHGGAFWKALMQRGIKIKRKHSAEERGGSTSIPQPRSSLANGIGRPVVKPRIDGLLRKLRHLATEPMLFSASCVMAEIIAQAGMRPRDAVRLLEQTVKETALWAQLGRDEVRRTIGNGFRHVEEKLLNATEGD